jgi:hypothetical protein
MSVASAALMAEPVQNGSRSRQQSSSSRESPVPKVRAIQRQQTQQVGMSSIVWYLLGPTTALVLYIMSLGNPVADKVPSHLRKFTATFKWKREMKSLGGFLLDETC